MSIEELAKYGPSDFYLSIYSYDKTGLQCTSDLQKEFNLKARFSGQKITPFFKNQCN